jgi:hypothetical protein
LIGEEMFDIVGKQVYSKSQKYDGGRVCQEKNSKYIIDTGNGFLEVDENELKENFYWEDNVQ